MSSTRLPPLRPEPEPQRVQRVASSDHRAHIPYTLVLQHIDKVQQTRQIDKAQQFNRNISIAILNHIKAI